MCLNFSSHRRYGRRVCSHIRCSWLPFSIVSSARIVHLPSSPPSSLHAYYIYPPLHRHPCTHSISTLLSIVSSARIVYLPSSPPSSLPALYIYPPLHCLFCPHSISTLLSTVIPARIVYLPSSSPSYQPTLSLCQS